MAVWADKKRVQQVLANLIGNAVEVHPPGDASRSRCGREGDFAHISVAR